MNVPIKQADSNSLLFTVSKKRKIKEEVFWYMIFFSKSSRHGAAFAVKEIILYTIFDILFDLQNLFFPIRTISHNSIGLKSDILKGLQHLLRSSRGSRFAGRINITGKMKNTAPYS